MGPCFVCNADGCYGLVSGGRHLWACPAHRDWLPVGYDARYWEKYAADREKAMREMARYLVRTLGRDEVARIGKDRLQGAFDAGVDALVELRSRRLTPAKPAKDGRSGSGAAVGGDE